jgi:general secretion pathway protein F
MPKYRYRAITQSGELVNGTILAPNSAEVERRIDYLRLVPIADIVEEASATPRTNFQFQFARRPRSEEVTAFTLDLALLLRAGVRLDDALELLTNEGDVGRLRPVLQAVRSSILSGETLAQALGRHADIFPASYLALVRVGESSGALDRMLEMLARERSRADVLRRKLADALRYPAFVLFAAVAVLVFFLTFVLPQFSTILHDFGAQINPITGFFMQISNFLDSHKETAGLTVVITLISGLLLFRNTNFRVAALSRVSRLPFVKTIASFHQSALFCRNLHVLLTAAVPLTSALRILVQIMLAVGGGPGWSRIVEPVRHGAKLSDALAENAALPPLALRMLRIGEESGQLPVLAERVADYYETKLERSLDRLVGIAGPAAIIAISTIVGGLIVSVMTSLLSVTQLVG